MPISSLFFPLHIQYLFYIFCVKIFKSHEIFLTVTRKIQQCMYSGSFETIISPEGQFWPFFFFFCPPLVFSTRTCLYCHLTALVKAMYPHIARGHFFPSYNIQQVFPLVFHTLKNWPFSYCINSVQVASYPQTLQIQRHDLVSDCSLQITTSDEQYFCSFNLTFYEVYWVGLPSHESKKILIC